MAMSVKNYLNNEKVNINQIDKFEVIEACEAIIEFNEKNKIENPNIYSEDFIFIQITFKNIIKRGRFLPYPMYNWLNIHHIYIDSIYIKIIYSIYIKIAYITYIAHMTYI